MLLMMKMLLQLVKLALAQLMMQLMMPMMVRLLDSKVSLQTMNSVEADHPHLAAAAVELGLELAVEQQAVAEVAMAAAQRWPRSLL